MDKKTVDYRNGEKKVLHVVTSLHFGGVERHMQVLADTCQLSEYTHQFCAIGSGGSAANKLVEAGKQVTCLNLKVEIPNIVTFYKLFVFLSKQDINVVHLHGAEANFFGFFAAKLVGIRVIICEEIGIPSHSKLAKNVFSFIYKISDAVVGVSDVVSEWLIANEAKKEKVITLDNPVGLPELEVLSRKRPDFLRIGFMGRLEKVKNPMGLLEAFYYMVDEGYKAELWIVGEGSERGRLESYIDGKGLEGCVQLFGFKENPHHYLSQCHVFIQPSISEGFGLALVEAMGCETACISTPVGAADKIIEEGVTGWVTEDSSVNSLISKLKEVCELPLEQLIGMGEKAREDVLPRFNAEQYIVKLDALYGKFLKD